MDFLLGVVLLVSLPMVFGFVNGVCARRYGVRPLGYAEAWAGARWFALPLVPFLILEFGKGGPLDGFEFLQAPLGIAGAAMYCWRAWVLRQSTNWFCALFVTCAHVILGDFLSLLLASPAFAYIKMGTAGAVVAAIVVWLVLKAVRINLFGRRLSVKVEGTDGSAQTKDVTIRHW